MSENREETPKLFTDYYKWVSFSMAVSMMYPKLPVTRLQKWGVLLAISLIGSATIFTVVSMIKCFIMKDIYNATRQITISVPLFLMTTKVIIAFYYIEDLRSLIDVINEEYSRIDSMKDHMRKAMITSIKEGLKVEKIWAIMITITACLFPVVAIYEMVYESLVNNTQKRIMIFEFFVPFFDDRKYDVPLFHIMFIYTMIIIVVTITNFIGFEPVFLIFVIFCRHQFFVIGESFKLIMREAKTVKELKCEIIRLIKIHQKLLGFAEKLNQIFGAYMFVIFTMSSVQVCVTIYQHTEAAEEENIKVEYMIFTITTIVQIFLPCYYGSMLSKASEDLGVQIFASGWENITDSDIRRKLFMVIMRTQKPVKLSASGILYLDMANFISILNTSYSYFTLLQSSNKK